MCELCMVFLSLSKGLWYGVDGHNYGKRERERERGAEYWRWILHWLSLDPKLLKYTGILRFDRVENSLGLFWGLPSRNGGPTRGSPFACLDCPSPLE